MFGRKPAAVALAAVAAPLPLHVLGQSHHRNAPSPLHARRVQTIHPHAAAPAPATEKTSPASSATRPPGTRSVQSNPARTRLPTVSSHTWRLAFPSGSTRARYVAAHEARDPSDTISNFKFTPGTLTIHVGDTVTWTNNDPVQHTATASNGSFNTGLISKGQSASHTFTTAGTFPYICTIHPFMHGTIVVLAASTSSTPSNTSNSGTSGTSSNNSNSSSGSGSGSTGGSNNGSSNSSNSSNASTTSPSSSSSTSSSTLPDTGLNLIATLFSAGGLIGVGLVLRRRSRA